jgi:hypothetical protein
VITRAVEQFIRDGILKTSCLPEGSSRHIEDDGIGIGWRSACRACLNVMPVPATRTEAEPPCSVRNWELTSASQGHPRVHRNPEYTRPVARGPSSSPSSSLLWVPLVAGRTTLADHLVWAASAMPTIKSKVRHRQRLWERAAAQAMPALAPAVATPGGPASVVLAQAVALIRAPPWMTAEAARRPLRLRTPLAPSPMAVPAAGSQPLFTPGSCTRRRTSRGCRPTIRSNPGSEAGTS